MQVLIASVNPTEYVNTLGLEGPRRDWLRVQWPRGNGVGFGASPLSSIIFFPAFWTRETVLL